MSAAPPVGRSVNRASGAINDSELMRRHARAAIHSHTHTHRCVRLNQKCVVLPKPKRWQRGGEEEAEGVDHGGGGGGGNEKPAPVCLEAAVEGTLVALLEGVQRPDDCAASMVLAVHRLMSEDRCDRGRALRTM